MTISVTQKRVKCSHCSRLYHSDCVQLNNDSSRSLWKCPTCVTNVKKGTAVRLGNIPTASTPPDKSLASDSSGAIQPSPLGAAGELMAEIRSFRAEIRERLDNQETSLKNFERNFDSMRNDVQQLQTKVSELDSGSVRVDLLENKLEKLVERNDWLEYETNQREQRDRFNNIEISIRDTTTPI